eukprot:m.620128 g.620128  ORF g.620128 m.620128 type:complete len:96 (+) comp22531_c0_seq11:2123-2410(+)
MRQSGVCASGHRRLQHDNFPWGGQPFQGTLPGVFADYSVACAQGADLIMKAHNLKAQHKLVAPPPSQLDYYIAMAVLCGVPTFLMWYLNTYFFLL